MSSPRDVLTPDALGLLQAVATHGSFAAAARELGLVPSAVTYRIRQLEDALDVLLFDRSSRQARLTAAGDELLCAGQQLLQDIDAVAHRVRRVATGWEAELTIAIDCVLSTSTIMELAEAFYALQPITRLRLQEEALAGTLEAVSSGRADLALGVVLEPGTTAGVQSHELGDLGFVYAVAPHHPLASAAEPIPDDVLVKHRAVAVSDSAQQRASALTMGLLAGQEVFTVSTMRAKLDAQLRGLGGGFLPEPMARPYLASGQLVARSIQRPNRRLRMSYAWRHGGGNLGPGRALQWWLAQLESEATRTALLERHGARAPSAGMSGYRGRFAPSPTGPLHAGSLVAALGSWLDARAQGGRWLVRIEDVDIPRCVSGADAEILRQLDACGLRPDEPPTWQSRRTSLYQAALDRLVAGGHAYPCACSRKDVELALRAMGREKPRHGELVYPGTCRSGLHGRAPRAWRFRVPEGVLPWTDRRVGVQLQDVAREVGDFVLRRADGLFAYQLAVVVDDADQRITHVVRGEDLVDNTPRQVLLQRALGVSTPLYLHMPLVLGDNGEKLSKQNGAAPLDLSDPRAALARAAGVLDVPLQAHGPLSEALDAAARAWGARYPSVTIGG